MGGDTIGILGNGIGVIYPAANRALYERVARDGLLLTEMPPGERPRIYTFPHRNRLIAGLATVTVVVEAARTSGSLITAAAALDAGREVMAVPGPITADHSVGTNAPDSRWRCAVPHRRGSLVARLPGCFAGQFDDHSGWTPPQAPGSGGALCGGQPDRPDATCTVIGMST